MAGRFIGVDAKAYYSITDMTGTWVALNIISDVKIPMAVAEAAMKDRSSAWVKYLPGFRDASITFKLSRVVGNTAYKKLRDAHLNRTPLGFAFMNGTITVSGNEGLQLDGIVTGFDINEPDEEGSTVDVTIKPYAGSSNEPAFVDIA